MFANALLLSLAAAASTVLAAPTGSSITDATVAQFALTLEHLENAFYQEGLDKFDAHAFEAAGFPSFVRGRFEQILRHESTHVTFLQSVLGDAATKPCSYKFPVNDPRSFVALASVLETVGASAYLGAAQLITDKNTLTAAGSILALESRQAGWIQSSVLKNEPWNGAFETPISPSGAYSLAAGFITSCPASNPSLPVKAFPGLTLSMSAFKPNSPVKVQFEKMSDAPAKYLAWFTGLQVIFTDIDSNGMSALPEGLFGIVYAGVVSSKEVAPSDDTMLSGLSIVHVPFDSSAVLPPNY